jgi:hypothetical protein
VIEVGDLVQAREGSVLDVEGFDGAAGLVLALDYCQLRVGGPQELEILVEWIGARAALWENPVHLEKCSVD